MNGGGIQESDEERLDRLEREEEEKNAMVELETKTLDAKREMAVADALDEIRTRNARNERIGKDGSEVTVPRATIDEEKERQEREDEKAARRAFMRRQEALEEVIEDDEDEWSVGPSTLADEPMKEVSKEMPPPNFKCVVKKKKDFSAALGIKKKAIVGMMMRIAGVWRGWLFWNTNMGHAEYGILRRVAVIYLES